MVINLHHLRLFAAVVDHGGFTKAADALHLSQPAISKSLTELERQLDVGLIDRGAKSVVLTEAGKALYTRARELFGIERAAEHELRELRGLERGVLRIGASTTIATYMLPPILGRFRSRHPKVRIQVTSANTRSVLRLLLEFRVDVAMVEGPVSHPRVEVRPWRRDDLVVISHPTHQLLFKSHVDPAMLAHETFLIREPGSGTGAVSRASLSMHGVRLRNTMRVGGTEAIKQGVAAGLGLGIVSQAAAADQLALGRLAVLPVQGLEIGRMLTQIRLRGRASTPAASALEQLLSLDRDEQMRNASSTVG